MCNRCNGVFLRCPPSRAPLTRLAPGKWSLLSFSENHPPLQRAPLPKNLSPIWDNSGPVTGQREGIRASGKSNSEGHPAWVPVGPEGTSLWLNPCSTSPSAGIPPPSYLFAFWAPHKLCLEATGAGSGNCLQTSVSRFSRPASQGTGSK